MRSCILLEVTVSPNPACWSGEELQPVARFQPCCLQTTDCYYRVSDKFSRQGVSEGFHWVKSHCLHQIIIKSLFSMKLSGHVADLVGVLTRDPSLTWSTDVLYIILYILRGEKCLPCKTTIFCYLHAGSSPA